MSAEGCSVRTRCESFCHFLCSTDRTDRHTSSKCFCHGHDIRFDPVMHIAHHITGSAPACLDLINKKEHIVLITEFPESLHKFHGCRMDTALALYRLYHDGNGIFRAGIFKSLKIIVRCIGKSVGHGTEADLASVSRLACG